jgi:nicotinamide mononucleotide adenylyltransferase
MMMMQEQTIIIEDQQVALSQLDEKQKYLVAQVTDINSKLAQIKFTEDQLNVAKTIFSNELVASWKSKKKEEKQPEQLTLF